MPPDNENQNNQTANSQPKKATVLIIEDDALLLKMYKNFLELEGFQVITAEDGKTGLKCALDGKANIILLDIMLPKLSGLNLLTQLRQHPKGKNIPVLVLSNLGETKTAKKALDLGAKEFLLKVNLTPKQVATKINQYLAS